jgi:hypothetical protein
LVAGRAVTPLTVEVCSPRRQGGAEWSPRPTSRPRPSTFEQTWELLGGSRYHRAMSSNQPNNANNIPTDRPRRQIPHEEIALLAERIWNERNRPTDKDEAIWLEAESRLQSEAESKPVAGTESRSNGSEPAKPIRTQTKSRDPAESRPQTRSALAPAPQKPAPGKFRNQ